MIAQGLLSNETLTARLAEIKARRGEAPWVERVAVTDEFSITAICQPPGHPNDHHYHLHDECWFIAEGELSWQYEHAPEPHYVKAGDIVFAPKNLWHHIEVHGDKPSIRIAVTPAGEFHRYDRPGCRQLEKKA
ncbi:MAG TPA: cupin domain-containing protein [Chloroflexota bacterium]|nr:cupin domain-containing protein [Chloroflexota bacterium]